MMLHVANVVESDVTERDRRVIGNPALDVAFGLCDVGDSVREMAIVGGPQFDEIRPRCLTHSAANARGEYYPLLREA